MEEKNNQSIVNFCFVLTGAIAYFISNVILEVLAGTFGAVAQARSSDLVRHGVPVGIGVAVILVLFLSPKIQAWGDEVISEVSKVVWPSRKDVIAMTIVCCVMVVVAGIGLGVYDFLASQLIKVFVN